MDTYPSVYCAVCQRYFSSAFSKKRHEMSQHKDMNQKIQKPKIVAQIGPVENRRRRKNLLLKAKGMTKVNKDTRVASLINSERDEKSEDKNSDSNESQSETDDENVWEVLLELLAFRVRNGYYGETDLDHLKKIEQIWEPPFYNDLILKLRELVQNLRRINVLIENDVLMKFFNSKKNDIRQGWTPRTKFLDKDLLDENDLDEMAWDHISDLLKRELKRHQLTIEQEFFDSETEGDMSTEEGEDYERNATGRKESGTAEELIESEDGATGIQELGSGSHTTSYPGNHDPPPYVSP